MRGQRSATSEKGTKPRIIPARAGPTGPIAIPCRPGPDHPRSCGANVAQRAAERGSTGSSPLVRGQLVSLNTGVYPLRIIPARAGPTDFHTPHAPPNTDHPRSCGANPRSSRGPRGLRGSSPLVRGQRRHDQHQRLAARIIPARAGPTYRQIDDPKSDSDHPRSCGANADNLRYRRLHPGSSPLVRGQLVFVATANMMRRIIPARAGPTPNSLS